MLYVVSRKLEQAVRTAGRRKEEEKEERGRVSVRVGAGIVVQHSARQRSSSAMQGRAVVQGNRAEVQCMRSASRVAQ
jgi:hypothetical protein